MSTELLSPIRITEAQRKALEVEKKRTGNTFAVIVRNLIQEQLCKAEKS